MPQLRPRWQQDIYKLLLVSISRGQQTFLKESESEVTPCPTLCDPMDCSLPGSSLHGIFQARILEWVAIPSSRGSSWPRCWSWVSYISCFGRRVVYHYHHLGTWEGISIYKYVYMNKLWSERRLQRGGLKYFHIFFEMFPFKRWMQILLLHSC